MAASRIFPVIAMLAASSAVASAQPSATADGLSAAAKKLDATADETNALLAAPPEKASPEGIRFLQLLAAELRDGAADLRTGAGVDAARAARLRLERLGLLNRARYLLHLIRSYGPATVSEELERLRSAQSIARSLPGRFPAVGTLLEDGSMLAITVTRSLSWDDWIINAFVRDAQDSRLENVPRVIVGIEGGDPQAYVAVCAPASEEMELCGAPWHS